MEEISEIQRKFNISDHLSINERDKMANFLFENMDLFVTEENPKLGYTNLVEHKIILKDNFVGKHHKPHRLYQFDPEDKNHTPKIVRYGSKSLNSYQQYYGPTKLELLGMVVSILDCNDYLRGAKFVVECDHKALQPLYQKQFKGA